MSGDLIALALLLKIVFKTYPKMLEVSNKNKKLFSDLLKSPDQVLIYSRFKVLNNISTFRSQSNCHYEHLIEKKIFLKDNKLSHIFYSSIALDDIDTVERIVTTERPVEIRVCEDDIVLGISADMNCLMQTFTYMRNRRRRSDYEKFFDFFSLAFFCFSSFKFIRDAIRYQGPCSRSKFDVFNYLCTIFSEYRLKEILRFMRYDRKVLTKMDMKILTRIYPHLAEEYAPQLGQFVAEDFGQLQDPCPICREAYVIGDKCFKLNCSHQFHEDCLYSWNPIQHSCPMCRKYVSLPVRDTDTFDYESYTSSEDEINA